MSAVFVVLRSRLQIGARTPTATPMQRVLQREPSSFFVPIRPYYRGVFSYKIALYPYALVFAITVLPILIAITFLGIMYGILLLYLYSKRTKRAYGKEEDRDNALRKQVPSNTATKTSLPSQS